MTTPGAATGLDFQTKKKKRNVEHFAIDGHPVTVTRPKWAWFEDLAARAGDNDPKVRRKATDELLDKVFDAKSAVHLRERLDDDADDFDLEDLSDLTEVLIEKWGGDREGNDRPTGRSGGTSTSSARTTKRSTARSR